MAMGRKLTRRWRWIAAAALALWLGIRWTLPTPLVPSNFSTAAYDREGRLLGAAASVDGQWRFPPSDSVPHRFQRALLVAEDHRFGYHLGVDPLALLRAWRSNLSGKGRRQGGSTLTMQLARISRRTRGGEARRTIRAKIAEIWLAVRIELSLPKERILDLYCAHAPFGGNVVGLEAASWRWYGKAPEDLSWGEAAAVAAIPNAPSLLRPGADTARLRDRRDRILRSLLRSGDLDSTGWSLALQEELPGTLHSLPREAPHVLGLFQATGQGHRWKTEIDGGIQRAVAGLALEHAATLRGQGIKDLAVVVVELLPGEAPAVRAWVGGVENSGPTASVDLALAPRSTGSTLKPFLYGFLLDRGRILPGQWLADIPTRYGDFRPANASGGWEGFVPADRALARSLNVPWVRELRGLGVEPFHRFLREGGLWHLFRPSGDYGLALALGAGEASLGELCALYAGLGSRGLVQPLSLAESDAGSFSIGGSPRGGGGSGSLVNAHRAFLAGMRGGGTSMQVLSPGASYLALKAMMIPGRSEEEAFWRAFAGSRPVAWKTGTSFGHRDAWAFGVTPRWVVGVWAGNAEGDGRPRLWGSSAAAPLMFRILPALPLDSRPWYAPPTDLVQIEVCPETGWRRSVLCRPGTFVAAPPAGRGAPLDTFHQVVHLDSTKRFQVDAGCEPLLAQRMDTLLVPPPGTASFTREARHLQIPAIPPIRSDCHDVPRLPAIDILLPENGARLTLARDLGGGAERTVAEVRHRDPQAALRCFLDGHDLGMEERFRTWGMNPVPGKHELVCADEAGETARSRFFVDYSARRAKDPLPGPTKLGTMAVQ